MDFYSPTKKADKNDDKFQVCSAFGALLKNSMGNKLLTFFEEMVKPALQQSQQQIASTYQKINNFIDEIHSHIQKKLEQHEKEVYDIVREEMIQAHEEVRKLARELSQKITLRNENQEVWFLSNELDYFKNEAHKLFSSNKELRISNKLLLKTIKDYEIQLESFELTLQKLKRRSMREKSIKKVEKPAQSMRESTCIKIRTKESLLGKKRMATELSSFMRTEVERNGREFDDSRINIQLSNASNPQIGNDSITKNIQNSPILITLDDQDKSIENVTIPNLSGQSYKTKKSRLSNHRQATFRQSFLQQRPILQCLDKYTQTESPKPQQNREASLNEVNQSRTSYDLDLFRNGFRLNATHMKTKQRIEIPLRSSVDYQKGSGGGHIRTMNSSFLKNRIEDSSQGKKKGSLFKQGGLLVGK